MPAPPDPPAASPDAAEPFDRAALRAQRARMSPGHDFIAAALAADLRDRVSAATRHFAVAADLGGVGIAGDEVTVAIDVVAGGLAAGHPAGGRIVVNTGGAGAATATGYGSIGRLVGDLDRLPLADASVDLIAALGLHAVNDLPGALILGRRALRPGGLFVAAFPGGATLAEVRADLLAAEVALTGRAAARVLPMVDPAAAPGLLQRAGFADPVAEVDTLTVRYADLWAALRDLRRAGEGNILRGREPLRRDVLADAGRRFADRAVDGRVTVTVEAIFLTGWGR